MLRFATDANSVSTSNRTARSCIAAVSGAMNGWEKDDLDALTSRLARAERICDETLPNGEEEDEIRAFAQERVDDLLDSPRNALFEMMTAASRARAR